MSVDDGILTYDDLKDMQRLMNENIDSRKHFNLRDEEIEKVIGFIDECGEPVLMRGSDWNMFYSVEKAKDMEGYIFKELVEDRWVLIEILRRDQLFEYIKSFYLIGGV